MTEERKNDEEEWDWKVWTAVIVRTLIPLVTLFSLRPVVGIKGELFSEPVDE